MDTRPGQAQMRDYNPEDRQLTESFDTGFRRESQQLVRDPRSMSGVVSFLSSNEKEGGWEVPRKFRALAVLGNVELDLRDARIGYGLSTIEAVAVLGNIEITIPPEISIECDGDSLMGSFTLRYNKRTSPSMANGERVIRVSGSAYVGAVTVIVKPRK
jgi:hypothetical protein